MKMQCDHRSTNSSANGQGVPHSITCCVDL
jgi:hypothetical protein